MDQSKIQNMTVINMVQFIIADPLTVMFLGGRRNLDNTEQPKYIKSFSYILTHSIQTLFMDGFIQDS